MSGRVIADEVAHALAGRVGLAWLDGDGAFGEEGRWSFLGSDPIETRSAAWGSDRPLVISKAGGEGGGSPRSS